MDIKDFKSGTFRAQRQYKSFTASLFSAVTTSYRVFEVPFPLINLI